jgi:hypothetical protein
MRRSQGSLLQEADFIHRRLFEAKASLAALLEPVLHSHPPLIFLFPIHLLFVVVWILFNFSRDRT